jgi:hypothetical protein
MREPGQRGRNPLRAARVFTDEPVPFVISNVAVYFLGVVILIAALGWGAIVAGLAATWIAVGALILLALSIVGAVQPQPARRPGRSVSDEKGLDPPFPGC